MPYAIYLRKSRADMEAEQSGAGETLARHEKTLLDLAHKMELPIVEIYREIVSGETIDARPEVRRLLSEVENGAYDGVLVMDADRLARGDTVDQGIISRAFRLSGTKIITPRKTYDPNSEFDEEYFEFELFMARREYKIINRRIQRGRIASVNEGRFIGSIPPYGYDKVKIQNGKGYTLKPNSESDTVKYIFDRYIAGNGASVIANSLDDMGVPTRSGNPWSKATITDILKNPVYTGKIRWSHRKDIKQSVNGQIVTVRKNNGDCILVDGLHEAIISTDDFEAAQVRLSENKKKPVRASDVLQNPFTGLIYCGKCGAKMTRLGRNVRNKYDTIKCTNRKCDCVSAPIFLVEQSVLDSMRKWLSGYIYRINQQDLSRDETDNNAEKKIAELTEELKKIDVQVNSTYDLLEQKVYTVEVFMQRNKALTERRNKIENRISCLRQSLITIQNERIARQEIIPHIRYVITAYKDCTTAEEKNALLKSALNRIEYSKCEPNRRGHLDNANFTVDVFPKVSDDIS
ncbi:MAG: recombinase family protein [Oscillospiraceae bacterium]|nr:recombinase family protein [Oscillospiraceae bacterium]